MYVCMYACIISQGVNIILIYCDFIKISKLEEGF